MLVPWLTHACRLHNNEYYQKFSNYDTVFDVRFSNTLLLKET